MAAWIQKIGLFLLILTQYSFGVAWAITIEEAYKAIPHHQTTYRMSDSPLHREISGTIEQLFHLVDQAIVGRVEALDIVRSSKNSVEKQATELEALARRIESLPVEGKAGDAAQLIGSAVREQARYLVSIAGGDRSKVRQLAEDSRVRSASEKLKRAYSTLLQAFPQESVRNKQAFFDHLCALDFI